MFGILWISYNFFSYSLCRSLEIVICLVLGCVFIGSFEVINICQDKLIFKKLVVENEQFLDGF